MSFSAANDVNSNCGVKTAQPMAADTSASPTLNALPAMGIGSADASPALANSFVNRSILKELNTNDNNNILSPLPTKTPFNSSKPLTSSSSSITHSPASTQMHTPKTTTTGSSATSPAPYQVASPGAFEVNATLHKFAVDPEMETGVFDDHHQLANELHSTSSVKKSSNKFVGLTAFDEDKIPDLPGDLNPNIEEQYSVTYEECFIPTLEAKQNTKSEFALPKTHPVLLNDADTFSSTSNEIFSDCLDDRGATFLEQPNLCDTTSNNDGYESAVNDIVNDEDIPADITMEISLNRTQIIDNKTELQSQQDTPKEYEIEPMDIDMNATLEIIHKSAENIESVEKVLQHVENVLQDLDEEKENISNVHTKHNICEAKVIGSIVKPTEFSKMTFIVNSETTAITGSQHSPHLEMEQSNHDVSLNKSIELRVKSVTPLSSECVITAMTNNENSEVELKNSFVQVDNRKISTESSVDVDKNDTSAHSMDTIYSSKTLMCKSPIPKLNSTLNMNTSTSSLSSLAPLLPSFPIKEQQITQTFPKSPKSRFESPLKATFLEKSDYVEKLEQKLKEKGLENQKQDLNKIDTSLKPLPTLQTKDERYREDEKQTETTDDSTISTTGMAFPAKTLSETSRRTFCIDTISDEPLDKNESEKSNTKTSSETSRGTFTIDKVSDEQLDKEESDKSNSRLTFTLLSDGVQTTDMNTSIVPMDIDESINQSTSALHDASYTQDKSQSQNADEINPQLASIDFIPSKDSVVLDNVEDQSFDLHTMVSVSVSPPLPLVEYGSTSNLPSMPNRSQYSESEVTQNKSPDTTPLPTPSQNISNSPPLTAMQERSHSPPLSTSTQNISDSPPQPISTQNISDSSPLPISTQNTSNSPPLPAMHKRSDSPPLPVLKNRSLSYPSTMEGKLNSHTQLANQNLDRPIEKNERENNNPRQTFNISSDAVHTTEMNTTVVRQDIDKKLKQTTSPLHEAAYTQEKSESQDAAELNSPQLVDNKPSANLPNMPNRSQSADSEFTDIESAHTSPLTTSIQNISNSPPLPAMQKRSNSPPLPAMQKRSNSPPLPAMQKRSNSPPFPVMQESSNSPPLPAMQKRSNSPPLPAMQKRSNSPPLHAIQKKLDTPSLPISTQNISCSPPMPAMQKISDSPPFPALKKRSVSPSSTMKIRSNSPPLPTQTPIMSNQSASAASFSSEFPPVAKIQKRPSIHDYGSREKLSAKEQSSTKMQDEKDELVEKFTPSPLETVFNAESTTLTNTSSDLSSFDQNSSASPTVVNNAEELGEYDDDEFQGNNNLILNPCDFDYLLTKGNNNTPVDRSSLLLKFDPLLGVPVLANQGQQQQKQPLHLQIPTTNNPNNHLCLSPTIEEEEHNDSKNRSFVVEKKKASSSLLCGLGRGAAGSVSSLSSASLSSAKSLKERSQEVKQQSQQQNTSQNNRQLSQLVNKKNATMSVDVIKDMSLDNNDCNKTFEHSNSTQSDDKQVNYKMDELEKKIKNEVLKTEDIEKKLKDAEQREEALIKRITEKDKTVAKMTGVIEAYEKAIAELIAEKEQLIQNYEQQLAEIKSDRDSNYQHLTSLETTFSDLHVKYEKSKEMTCQLKGNEEALTAENRKNSDNLRLQEQRYDKMKNHAMQQLEIANKKLECLTREHTMEITKLKALLKKEEIARSSMSEQLAQKTKENTELVKICDELIQGQGS